MARYVVLEFDDNETAEGFVKALDNSWSEYAGVIASSTTAKPVTVLAKPTLFCTCNVEYSNKNFAKSKRYGWTVHVKCHRPTKEWADRHVLSQARDLLPEMRENHATDPGDG